MEHQSGVLEYPQTRVVLSADPVPEQSVARCGMHSG